VIRRLLLCSLLAMSACNVTRQYEGRDRYVLDVPEIASDDAGPARGVLRVTRARVAPPYGARAFQYLVAPGRLDAAVYDVWADDPGALVSAAFIEALAASGRFEAVVDDASMIPTAGTLDLYVSTLHADVQSSPVAVVAMRVTLVEPGGDVAMTGSYEVSVPAASSAPADVLEAWNAGLGRIVSDVLGDMPGG
jgi:ABC-type uncharacterized transport system auxiliary subunit